MSSVLCHWPAPPEDVQLSAEAVHLWCVPLDDGRPIEGDVAEVLTSDERARASRFYFERDRRRFIVGHTVQRLILARYLAVEPGAIRFTYGSRGKPALNAPWSESGLEFNLTHSDEVAVLAVTQGRQIGVDVEKIRPMTDADALAERFFALEEKRQLALLAPAERLIRFFHCWTRKEAVLKAVGTGLSFPLNKLAVSLGTEESCQVVSIDDELMDDEVSRGARWWLDPLEPAEGYVGAVASPGSSPKIDQWLWAPRNPRRQRI